MTNPTFKTKAMQLVEHRIGVPLEKYIADRYAKGASQAVIASELGIASATISRWMSQLGIEAQYGPKSEAA